MWRALGRMLGSQVEPYMNSPLRPAALLQAALGHHQAGRLPQAEALYRQILAREPRHADALHLLGVIAYQVRQYEMAAQLIGQAIEANPRQSEYHTNLGSVRQDQGQVDAAIVHYREALRLKPSGAEAHNNLGNALLARGEAESARGCYLEALKYRPDYAEAHNNLGNALQALGESGGAERSYREALRYRPEYAEAHNNLGNALQGQHKLGEAQASYRRALVLQPGFVKAQVNLGNALQESGELEASLVQYEAALAAQPGMAEAHNNLGNALKALKRGAEAIDHYRQAIALMPTYVEAHGNLGATLQEHGLLDEAIAHYRAALALRPDYAIGHNNLGKALSDRGRFKEAIACFRRALELDPDFDAAHSNLLLHLNNEKSPDPADYLSEAMTFGAKAAGRVQAYTSWPQALSASGERLRIGFVSGDLRNHPVGFFLESVVAFMDPHRFELVAYATKAGEDDLTRRLQGHFAQWHSLVGLSDQAAARRIHDDGIQILVDLAGHTADNRLPVFAWKPAPVQVAWLGYFASTGVKEIDYILADPQVLPAAEASHFVETPWRLPDCYLCFTPPHEDVEVGPLPQLENGYVTFGCFNKLSKMNERVVGLWSRVLAAVPGSRLVLKAKELTDVSAQESARARFVAHGIAGERIETQGYSTRDSYLAAYRRIDVALDPFPYPGGTTTVEALWMGVPVLSLRGERFLSHAGESLLGTAGLGDWVAASEDEYVAKARAMTADAAVLAAQRARLRVQLLSSPLCDAERFATNLGAAFEGMWAAYRGRGTHA